jgi:hypothetical protein
VNHVSNRDECGWGEEERGQEGGWKRRGGRRESLGGLGTGLEMAFSQRSVALRGKGRRRGKRKWPGKVRREGGRDEGRTRAFSTI